MIVGRIEDVSYGRRLFMVFVHPCLEPREGVDIGDGIERSCINVGGGILTNGSLVAQPVLTEFWATRKVS